MTEHDRPVAGRPDRISTPAEDVDTAWMARLSALSDPEVDSLLSGSVPLDSDDLAPIAEVARALRRRVLEDDVPEMSDDLRRQLTDAVLVPLAPRSALRLAVVKTAAAAAAVAAVVVGVGASQNSLPAGMQNAVSSAAELVGVEVPRADVRDDADPVETQRSRDAEGRTPGGATPADPGTPGDGEPAAPATPPDNGNDDPGTPPEQSNAGGNADPATPAQGDGTGGQPGPGMLPEQSGGGASPAPPTPPSAPGQAPDHSSAGTASETGQENRTTPAPHAEGGSAGDNASETGQSKRADPPPARR